MTHEAMIALAKNLGFTDAAVLSTGEIPFEPAFRVCCEDNACGKYGVNYACPPDCGTAAEMADRIRSRQYALLLQTMWEIADPLDGPAAKAAKKAHHACHKQLISMLSPEHPGFTVGVSGCDLCPVCAVTEGLPCRFPAEMFSCMSAYCIYVQQLTERCGMEYDSGPGLVNLFSLFVFDGSD